MSEIGYSQSMSLLTPPVKELMSALKEAYVVGGCVRDFYAGRPCSDIDMATPLTPEQYMRRLSQYKVVPTGLAHGTVTVVLETGQPIELTSFRADTQTDGRHAQVCFGTSLEQDALRRDFTINPLYMDAKERLYDVVGGLEDLRQHRVRFIGEADKRLEEDVLRLLRFFRFWGVFGKEPADTAALEACRAHAPRLTLLSKERRTAELFKILTLPNADKVLRLMYDTQVLPYLFKSNTLFEQLADLPPDPIVRLWTLLAEKVAPENLSFTRKQRLLFQKLTNA